MTEHTDALTALAETQATELEPILTPHGFRRDLTELRTPDTIGVSVQCTGLKFRITWDCPDAGGLAVGLVDIPGDAPYAIVRDIARGLTSLPVPLPGGVMTDTDLVTRGTTAAHLADRCGHDDTDPACTSPHHDAT